MFLLDMCDKNDKECRLITMLWDFKELNGLTKDGRYLWQ